MMLTPSVTENRKRWIQSSVTHARTHFHSCVCLLRDTSWLMSLGVN